MTNYFIDCEFIEDGRTIDLISIGLVCEDGREYYAINERSSARLVQAQLEGHWVVENVLPHLPTVPTTIRRMGSSHSVRRLDFDHDDVKFPADIRDDVYEFLVWGSASAVPYLWADYAAYDHVAFAQLWGAMSNFPKLMPMFTHELEQLWEQAGRPLKPVQADKQHHALWDARYDRDLFRTCQRAIQQKTGGGWGRGW